MTAAWNPDEARRMVATPRGYAPQQIANQLEAALAEIKRLTDERDDACVMPDLTAKLDALRAAYDEDRARRCLAAAPLADTPPAVCRYCGHHRWSLPGSRLDGHAHCVVSDEFKLRVFNLLNAHPAISFRIAGEALDVDIVNVRAWYLRAQKIRRAP